MKQRFALNLIRKSQRTNHPLIFKQIQSKINGKIVEQIKCRIPL